MCLGQKKKKFFVKISILWLLASWLEPKTGGAAANSFCSKLTAAAFEGQQDPGGVLPGWERCGERVWTLTQWSP